MPGYCPVITGLSAASDLHPVDSSIFLLWMRIDLIVYSAFSRESFSNFLKDEKRGAKTEIMYKRMTLKKGIASMITD